MAQRSAHLLCIAFLAAVAAGCGASAPSRFYTLDAVATADGAPPARTTVLVGPVAIPPLVDRPQFVVQVAPNQVAVDEFNRWAAPLDDAVARAVAGNLAVLLGTPDVAVAPLAGFAPDYRVTINVQRFEATRGEAALVDAVWGVRRSGAADSRAGRTTAREAVTDESFESLAAAYSRALAALSRDISAAIRAEAGAKP
jgi:uncharacterized lipoprotein YmbA